MTTRVRQWRKSSKSKTGSGGDDWCVEVADVGDGHRAIRDSKAVENGVNVSPEITMDVSTFGRFLAKVRSDYI